MFVVRVCNSTYNTLSQHQNMILFFDSGGYSKYPRKNIKVVSEGILQNKTKRGIIFWLHYFGAKTEVRVEEVNIGQRVSFPFRYSTGHVARLQLPGGKHYKMSTRGNLVTAKFPQKCVIFNKMQCIKT